MNTFPVLRVPMELIYVSLIAAPNCPNGAPNPRIYTSLIVVTAHHTVQDFKTAVPVPTIHTPTFLDGPSPCPCWMMGQWSTVSTTYRALGERCSSPDRNPSSRSRCINYLFYMKRYIIATVKFFIYIYDYNF